MFVPDGLVGNVPGKRPSWVKRKMFGEGRPWLLLKHTMKWGNEYRKREGMEVRNEGKASERLSRVVGLRRRIQAAGDGVLLRGNYL